MYVCICNNVTTCDILDAMGTGCQRLEDLEKKLKLGEGCGKCISNVKEIIEEEGLHDKQED